MNASRKLNNIQALRAFAAISVTLFHTSYTFPHMHRFGSFGIDVFFVISGYIMTRILDSAPESGSDFFFRRRLLRIVPPYWAFTIALFCMAAVAPQLMGGTRSDPVQLIKSLLFIPFVKPTGLIQPVLFLGWTLNLEMFFYVSLAIGQRLTRQYAAWAGSAIVLVVMFGCVPFAQSSILARFYSMPRILEFLVGVACYHLCQKVPDESAMRLRRVWLIGFASGISLLVFAEGVWGLRGIGEVTVLCAASVIAVGSASLLAQGGQDTDFTPVVLIGDASYILYLIHPYCELSIERFVGVRHHMFSGATLSGALVGVALSVIAALTIHVYAERPAMKLLYSHFGGRRRPREFSGPVPTPAD